MKTIVKSLTNGCLQRAVDKGWSWEDFVANDYNNYRQIREQAINDQREECAYTGLWIGEGTKQKIHLDHFYKKALYPEHRFNWSNLFAAAKDLDYGSDYKDKNIHGPKINSDDQYRRFYSPLEANLESVFWYQQDGRIDVHPDVSDDKIAIVENTIRMYNLNAPDLIYKRLGIIKQLRDLRQLDDETIRLCMHNAGFSFVVEFELNQRKI